MDLNEGRFTLNFQGQQKIQLFFWNTFDTNLANEVNWALSWLQQEKYSSLERKLAEEAKWNNWPHHPTDNHFDVKLNIPQITW